MKHDGNFPQDLMTLILLKSPVKSLIRFKCVCKTWYALIENPRFISAHLKSKNDKDSRLLVQCDSSYLFQFRFALFHDKSLSDLSYQVLDSQFDSQFGIDSNLIIALYNGLIGVYKCDSGLVYFGNISTRETRALPRCNIVIPLDANLEASKYPFPLFGFGYDPLTDDYKLVFVRQFTYGYDYGYENHARSHVSLYSFNNDCWRDLQFCRPLENMKLRFNIYSGNTCLNGVYYWLTSGPDNKDKIVSFDFSNEVFKVLDISIPYFGRVDPFLEVVDDSLNLVCDNNVGIEIQVWRVRGGCLTKQSTVSFDGIDNVSIRGLWKNDTVICLRDCNFVLYDLRSKEEKDLGIRWRECDWGTSIYKYNESLVSIKRDNDMFDIPWHVLGVYD